MCNLSGSMLVYLLCVACLLCVQDTAGQGSAAPLISVYYTIYNDLIGDYFKYSLSVPVSEGSTVLQVMEKAAELDPKYFSFATETTTWGQFVTTINQLGGSTNDKTYWQFFSGDKSLSEGVGSYKVHNEEHILAIFSKY